MPGNVTEEIIHYLDQFTAVDIAALIFTMESGAPLTAVTLQRARLKARRTIGCPDLHLHDLRHTGLTLAAATGATTAQLMHRAGHSSTNAALRYQHATKDRDRVLADALAALVKPATVIPIDRESRVGDKPTYPLARLEVSSNRAGFQGPLNWLGAILLTIGGV